MAQSKKKKAGFSISELSESVHSASNFNQCFERHFRVLAIIVIALAAGLRLWLLTELPDMPFSQLYKAPDLDMDFFDRWGQRIADGDILTDTVFHPNHFWHRMISDTLGLSAEAGVQQWNQWYGEKQYHQEPLYALILGAAKRISGEGHVLMYVLQMMLSLLSTWFIIWLGRHYFHHAAGILGGLLFVFYGPALLFDASLLRTSISTTFLLAMLVLGEQLMNGRKRGFLMGLIGGLSYLLMTTTLLVWLPITLRWLYVRSRSFQATLSVFAGFGICLSFLLYRNITVGAPLFSSSSVGAITYVMANYPGYQPENGFSYYPGAAAVMQATDGEMIPASLMIIGQHESFLDWVWLQVKKLGAVFHWFEIPNNINTYLAAEFSDALKFTFLPYSVILALAIPGLILNIRDGKTVNLLWALFVQVVIMVIFYVLCRFRVPMVAMLCVYAGFTLQAFGQVKSLKPILFLTGITVVCWGFVNRPWPEIPLLFTRGDLQMNFVHYYQPKIDDLYRKGDKSGAIELFKAFTATIPSYMTEKNVKTALHHPWQRDLAYYCSLVYRDIGSLYKETGDTIQESVYNKKAKKLIKAAGQY